MTTNLLTTITNTLVSVFIFAIFPVFCDADRQETASDVNVAGMVLIPADDMPQWLMRIGLASGCRYKRKNHWGRWTYKPAGRCLSSKGCLS